MLGGLHEVLITNMNSQHSGGRWRGWHCVLRRFPSSSTTDCDPVDRPCVIVSISTVATEIYNRLRRFTTGYRDLHLVNPPVILTNKITLISRLQCVSGPNAHSLKFYLKVKKSTNTVLPHTWCNFGGVIASEQNMKDACVQHKEKCCNMGKWKCLRTYTTKKWKCVRTYTTILSMILYKHSKPLNGKSIHYIIQFRYRIIILLLQNSTCAILYLLIHSDTPDCKVQGSNLSGKKCRLIVSKLWYIIWRGGGCKHENLLRQPPPHTHTLPPLPHTSCPGLHVSTFRWAKRMPTMNWPSAERRC